MMSDNTTKTVQQESNVSPGELNPVKSGQFKMETLWIIGFLIVALVVLKSFIYIKDEKRDGK
jgi:beta-lactamase regulating signal transducer with metallopeptidase domain